MATDERKSDPAPELFEVLENSLDLTQTNQIKQEFLRLDCWIQKVQFDEQNKSLTKCTMSKYYNLMNFCFACFVWVMQIYSFPIDDQ